MENQNETTFQKSCLSFIETLFPDESFHFLEESRAMDAFGHHGIQLFFSSELRTLNSVFSNRHINDMIVCLFRRKTITKHFFPKAVGGNI